MRNEDLVNKGWDTMLTTLDKEMPQKKNKKRPIIWFWLGSMVMLAFLVFYIFSENNLVLKPSLLNENKTFKKIDTTVKDKSKVSRTLKTEKTPVFSDVTQKSKRTKKKETKTISKEYVDKFNPTNRTHINASIDNVSTTSSSYFGKKQKAEIVATQGTNTLKTESSLDRNENRKKVIAKQNVDIGLLPRLNHSIAFYQKFTPVFVIDMPQASKVVQLRSHRLSAKLGFAYAPVNSLSGLQLGLTYHRTNQSKWSHGPSLSLLALDLSESLDNADLLVENVDTMDNPDNESTDNELSSGQSLSEEILTGTLYQLNASYGLQYKMNKGLNFGLDMGYAFALSSKASIIDATLGLNFANQEGQVEKRIREFVRPSLQYNLSHKIRLHTSYQFHLAELFRQGDDSRKYDYLNFGLTYRLY